MKNETITKDGRKYKLVPIDEPMTPPYRLTVTKHFDFEVYPHDLPEVMTLVKANEYIKENLPGWRVPTREELQLLYDHKDAIGGFKTSNGGSDYPDWYWSSTEDRDHSSYVHDVRFSDGDESWVHKDHGRLSCRPVRLVAASAPTPAPA